MANTNVKRVGADGQISLGKQFAGLPVLVEEHEAGVWWIRTANAAPQADQWLQSPKAIGDMRTALDWAQSHPAQESDLKALADKLDEAA